MNEEPDIQSQPRDERPDSLHSLTDEQIRELVRKSVEEIFRKEQDILKTIISLSIKIVGASLAVLVTMFALLGISTWSDMRRQVLDLADQKVSNLIDSDDSKEIRAMLDNLVNRLLTNVQISHRSMQSSDAGRDRSGELDTEEWRRLRKWLTIQNLSLSDFTDVLSILDSQSVERKGIDSAEIISAMLQPNREYKWILRQPEKIDAILENFKHPNLAEPALSILLSDGYSDRTRAAAALYVGHVGYYEGVERLLDVYGRTENGAVKWSALISCARLEPSNPKFVAKLSALISDSGESTDEKIKALLNILQVLPSTIVYSDDTDVETDKKEEDIIRFIVKSGVKFRLAYPRESYSPIEPSHVLEDWSERPVVFVSRTVRGSTYSLDRIGSEAFAGWQAYWVLLSKYANRGELEMFSKTLLENFTGVVWNDRPRALFDVLVTAPQGSFARVALADGQRDIDISRVRRVRLISTNFVSNDSTPLFDLDWIDASGMTHRGRLMGFVGEKFDFRLARFD